MKLWSRLALWLGQMLIGPELCPPSPLRMCRVWWSLRKVNMISRGRLRLWLARCPVVSAQCPVSVITLCNFAPGSPGPQSAELVLERLTHFHAVLVLRTYHISYTPTEDVYDSSKWTQPLTVKEVSPSRGCADGPSHRPRVSRLPPPCAWVTGLSRLGLPSPGRGLHTGADCSPRSFLGPGQLSDQSLVSRAGDQRRPGYWQVGCWPPMNYFDRTICWH